MNMEDIHNSISHFKLPNAQGLDCEMIVWQCGQINLARLIAKYLETQSK